VDILKLRIKGGYFLCTGIAKPHHLINAISLLVLWATGVALLVNGQWSVGLYSMLVGWRVGGMSLLPDSQGVDEPIKWRLSQMPLVDRYLKSQSQTPGSLG